ncbi:MAG TPA: rhodanese-like domain-containing protein [Kofleriaceae bacterium]|nr:rhodanese-like domain-containing protein [Kofleriaceae bacterium]
MLFEQIRSGGCLSYLIGCDDSCAAMIVDPHLDQLDRYIALTAERGMRVRYVAETHTHADHFSAARELGKRLDAKVVAHRLSAAPYVDVRVDDGETLVVGKLRVRVLATPGHTNDSICLVFEDRVLTGDALLIGGTGRTDLPSGDPDTLYDSLFGKLLKLPDTMKVYPSHDYKDRNSSTIGAEKASNPRLQKTERGEFVALMRGLDIRMPDHLTEALRTNRSGGKTVAQLLAEASREIAFMSIEEVRDRIERHDPELVLLDVREKDSFVAGHLPGAKHLPRGIIELSVDKALPDPSARILCYCNFGKISTLAAATLRSMGYTRAVALDGGYTDWVKAGYPTES